MGPPGAVKLASPEVLRLEAGGYVDCTTALTVSQRLRHLPMVDIRCLHTCMGPELLPSS